MRKSREDREAELRGEGETLARHRAALLELAKNRRLTIGAMYEEIVSGETIAARPQMQRLLEEVESGQWEGVLVMEVERLARGNGIDQGIVSQAFSVSGTRIITPYKTYDPSNEMDEDYFEFGLFMSRREYQTIRRRLIAGRIASVKEGKYMGGINPFGYRRVKLQGEKGWTLEIVPEQAEVVRTIYQWYLTGGGICSLSKRLLAAGYKTSTGLDWGQHSIMKLLRNPIYAGYVTWGHKKSEKTVKNGQLVKKRKMVKDYILARGRHEPIIPQETWDAVQKKLDETPSVPIPKSKSMRNPYQGLMFCAECGHKMQLSTISKPRKDGSRITYYGLFCSYVSCNNVSARMHVIDEAMTAAMQSWLASYQTEIRDKPGAPERSAEELQSVIGSAKREMSKTEDQLRRAFELVEQQIYTTEQFVKRQTELSERLEQQRQLIERLNDELDQMSTDKSNRMYIIPQMRHVIDAYPAAQTAEEKHELLRSVISRIEYRRIPEPGEKPNRAKITLDIYPRFPDAGHTHIKVI